MYHYLSRTTRTTLYRLAGWQRRNRTEEREKVREAAVARDAAYARGKCEERPPSPPRSYPLARNSIQSREEVRQPLHGAVRGAVPTEHGSGNLATGWRINTLCRDIVSRFRKSIANTFALPRGGIVFQRFVSCFCPDPISLSLSLARSANRRRENREIFVDQI